MTTTRLEHAGGAAPTTLAATIGAADTQMTIVDATGWPDGAVGPFYIVLSAGEGTEEKVLVASRTGTLLTVAAGGRGADDTTGQAHDAGAPVLHCWTAVEADQANAHTSATTGVHGTAGAVVGTTDAQVLSNKSIDGAANTLANVPQSAVTDLVADVANLDAHVAATAAHGTAGAVVGTTDTQTLSGKSISGATNTLSAVPQSAVTGLAAHKHQYEGGASERTSDLAIPSAGTDVVAVTTTTTGLGAGADILVAAHWTGFKHTTAEKTRFQITIKAGAALIATYMENVDFADIGTGATIAGGGLTFRYICAETNPTFTLVISRSTGGAGGTALTATAASPARLSATRVGAQ